MVTDNVSIAGYKPSMEKIYEHILGVASEAARHVGKRIFKEVNTPSAYNVDFKGPRDLVTAIDLWSESEILKIINAEFTNHIVLGEESSAELSRKESKSLAELSSKGFCWFVDPIDGTTNFVNAIPAVTVSIGVTHDTNRVVGVVFDPFRDELFTAIKGNGAKLNNEPVLSTKKSDLTQAVISVGSPYDALTEAQKYLYLFHKLGGKARAIRRIGCASLEQCWVACGRFDAFFEYNLKPWDVAAASLIVEEAGGRVGHFSNESKFSIFAKSLVVSGANLFDEVRQAGIEAEFSKG